jgi:hypothetical protein
MRADTPEATRPSPTTVTAPVTPDEGAIAIGYAASRSAAHMRRELGVSTSDGLAGDEVARRQARWGPNAVSSHRARLLLVLWHRAEADAGAREAAEARYAERYRGELPPTSPAQIMHGSSRGVCSAP